MAWFLPIAEQLHRVLKPSGTFVLNIKEPAVKGERHTHVIELILALREQGWLWTEEFVWHKKNCYPGKWPNRFRDAWERLLQFNKERKFKMNQEAVMVPVGDWYDGRMLQPQHDRPCARVEEITAEAEIGKNLPRPRRTHRRLRRPSSTSSPAKTASSTSPKSPKSECKR